MMKYLFPGLFLIILLSCETKKDNIEYRIERMNYDNFYSIKLVDKNDVEKVSINFNYDGAMVSYYVNDGKSGVLTNLHYERDGISYDIWYYDKYKNTTNYFYDEHDELLLKREEKINENIFEERIYKNGLVIKEKRTNSYQDTN